MRCVVGRTADKKEHENLFERRKREWKRVRSGELRMFTTEPLYGTIATVSITSVRLLTLLPTVML